MRLSPLCVSTVEPPNKGHFGNGHFVLFSEAVPTWRLAIV